MTFKQGDRVAFHSDPKFEGRIISISDGRFNVLWDNGNKSSYEDFKLLPSVNQKSKMQDISKFDKKALSDAVSEIAEERLDKQKEEAKSKLREIYSRKDTADDSKERLDTELKDISKELKVFEKSAK